MNYGEENKNILEKIKETILNYHPIVENRLENLIDCWNAKEMDIQFNFYTEDGKDYTDVVFLDGTPHCKSQIPKPMVMDGLLTNDELVNLIIFIISDHEVISSFSYNNNRINLAFNINYNKESLKGINCSKIELELDFNFYPEHEKLLNQYISVIITNFYEKIKNTDFFSREIERYTYECKEETIKHLSNEEIDKIFSLLTPETKRKILCNIQTDKFIKLYDEYDKGNQLVKK